MLLRALQNKTDCPPKKAPYCDLYLRFKVMHPLAGVKIMTVSCYVSRHEMTYDCRHQAKSVFV